MVNRKKLRKSKKGRERVENTKSSYPTIAKDPSREVKDRRSVVGALISALFMPCFGASTTRRRRTSKSKAKKEEYQLQTKRPQVLASKVARSCSSPCANTIKAPRPLFKTSPSVDRAITLQQEQRHDSERESVSGNFLNALQAVQVRNTDVMITDLEEEQVPEVDKSQKSSEEAQFEGDSSTTSNCSQGLPVDHLSTLPSNKRKLPPLKPTYLARAMSNMQRALEKVEQEENIPPIVPIKVLRQQTINDLEHRNKQDKYTAQLMQHAANGERQSMKTKLAEKKKAIKEEADALSSIKKRAKIDEKLEKIWEKDKIEMAPRSEEDDCAVQKYREAIQTLKREIELLKEKQKCKLLQYDLLRNKGYDSILSETVWQCKAMKIRLRYFSLGREIDELWSKVYSLQHTMKKLVPHSSSELGQVNIVDLEQAPDETDSIAQPGPSPVQPNTGHLSGTPISHSATTSKESSPVCRLELRRDQENKVLLELFIGESSKQSMAKEKEHTMKSQEKCQQTNDVSYTMSYKFSEPSCSYTTPQGSSSESQAFVDSPAREAAYMVSESDDDQNSNVIHLSEFEDDSREIEISDLPLHKNTRTTPLHELLPEFLYCIEEDTEDLDDYDNNGPGSRYFASDLEYDSEEESYV